MDRFGTHEELNELWFLYLWLPIHDFSTWMDETFHCSSDQRLIARPSPRSAVASPIAARPMHSYSISADSKILLTNTRRIFDTLVDEKVSKAAVCRDLGECIQQASARHEYPALI